MTYATAVIPDSSSNYLKFTKAETIFRILDEQIEGTRGWKKIDGKNTPIRVPVGEAINVDDVDDESNVKYFWAMPVYDYDDKQIKILEITQKTILKAIKGFANDSDYGDPKGYDIKVSKAGEGLETEYQVTPKPPKKLDEAITKSYKDMKIDLKALFTNDDPFKASEKKKEDDFVDEVSKAIDEV